MDRLARRRIDEMRQLNSQNDKTSTNCIRTAVNSSVKIPTEPPNMSMPPALGDHDHHLLPPGTTAEDIAAAAAAAVPSALNRQCGHPNCDDLALRGRGELAELLCAGFVY